MAKNVVAQRTLRIKSDPTVTIDVSVEMPSEDGDDYVCLYSIQWPQQTQHGRAVGVDSIQALSLAMSHLAVDIINSEFARYGDIYWLEPDDNCGLDRMIS